MHKQIELYEENLLIESMNSNIEAFPVLKAKWTWSRSYYGFILPVRQNTAYISWFENRWHSGGVKLGTLAYQLVVKEKNLLTSKSTLKPVKRIPTPFQYIAGLLQTLKLHMTEYSGQGYIMHLESKYFKYVTLLKRVAMRDKTLLKYEVISLDMGEERGTILMLVRKGRDPKQVFKNLYSKFSKSGIDFFEIVQSDEFFKSFQKNTTNANMKSKSFKIDLSDIFMPGRETEENKPYRETNNPSLFVNIPTDDIVERMRQLRTGSPNKIESVLISATDEARYKAGLLHPNKDSEEYREAFNKIYKESAIEDIALESKRTPWAYQNITGDEPNIKVIKEFTGSAYQSITSFLLKGKTENAKNAISLIEGMDSAFEEYATPISFPVAAYRGVNINAKFFEGNLNVDEVPKVESITGLLKRPYTFLPSYSSFSFDVSVADNFGGVSSDYIFESGAVDTSRAPEVTVEQALKRIDEISEMYISKTTGDNYFKIMKFNVTFIVDEGFEHNRFIVPGKASQYISEREIIFPRGCALQVKNVYMFEKEDIYSKLPKINLIIRFTIPSPSAIIGESIELNPGEIIMNESQRQTQKMKQEEKDALRKAAKEKYKKRLESLSKSELEDLKKKFGSNPFG